MNQVYFDDRLCYCFQSGDGPTSWYDYITDDFGNAIPLDNDLLGKQHVFLELC